MQDGNVLPSFSFISLIAEPSCLLTLSIFLSLLGSRLTIFLSRCKFGSYNLSTNTSCVCVCVYLLNWIIGTGWNWNSGNNRVRCSPDWSVYRCIERYCMTPRQRDDDNNLSVGNRNHLKLGIEPESWLQSHELGF